jgi:hypothetical protein
MPLMRQARRVRDRHGRPEAAGVERHKRAAFDKKLNLLKAAGGLLIIGFLVALAGVALH